MDQRAAHRILSGGGGAGGALLRAALAAASVPYSLAVRARRWAHANRLMPHDSLASYHRPGSGHPVRVISVGNLTAGGTGKTPMVAWVARRLKAMGLRPGVLLRGYKSGGGQGDEERLLRGLCGDCPVVANPNRFAGAQEAMAAGAEVMVLDDGFQHLRLARDLDIVLIDATNPFGFGHCLPRGLLREPPSALRFADELVLTRSDAVSTGELAALREKLSRLSPRAGLHTAVHAPTRFVAGEEELPLSAVRGKRVFAFCGIGNPGAFFATVQRLGAEVVGRRELDDHVQYTEDVLRRLRDGAVACRAEIALTTQKDGVKLAGAELGAPLWQLAIEMELTEGEAALVERIRRLCLARESAKAGSEDARDRT